MRLDAIWRWWSIKACSRRSSKKRKKIVWGRTQASVVLAPMSLDFAGRSARATLVKVWLSAGQGLRGPWRAFSGAGKSDLPHWKPWLADNERTKRLNTGELTWRIWHSWKNQS